jgi:hypothetical protein
MSLKPEVSLGVGLGTGAVVAAIYYNALPPMVDIRVGPSQDKDVSASRKAAAWTSAGIVGGISLLAKDVTIFAVGAGFIIVLDWWTRHSNAVDPRVSRATALGGMTANPGAPTQALDPADFPGYDGDLEPAYY